MAMNKEQLGLFTKVYWMTDMERLRTLREELAATNDTIERGLAAFAESRKLLDRFDQPK